MQAPSTNERVCFLSASTFSQEGGIQRVTRMLLRCLRENWPAAGIDLFSLHDRETRTTHIGLSRDIESGAIHYHPCFSSRLRYAAAALRQMTTAAPSLVISEHVHLTVLPWLAGSFVNFPWVSLVHYAELPGLGVLRRRALQKSDLIIAVSEFTAREARRLLGVRCPPIVVCHLGLHPEYAAWADAQRKTLLPGLAGRRNVLIVGRMADHTRDKGHEALIRALPEVCAGPRVQLVIVGRGGHEPYLRRLTAELALDAHVYFAGSVPDEELPAYYAAAEVFAMPSFAEGFGLVYLEAMYHGKPCIAGSRDAAGEVVCDGETGLLVEPGNVAQIQDGLLRLLLEPEWARQLGANGRARLDEQFTYEHFAARMLQALKPFVPVAPAGKRACAASPAS